MFLHLYKTTEFLKQFDASKECEVYFKVNRIMAGARDIKDT